MCLDNLRIGLAIHGALLPVYIGLILIMIALINILLSYIGISISINWSFNLITNIYLVIIPLSLWLTSLYITAFRKFTILNFVHEYDNINRSYFSKKRRIKRFIKIVLFVLIPSFGMFFNYFDYFNNTPFSYLIYYSYICLLLISLITISNFDNNSMSLIGLYSIIGMSVLWFIPSMHPFFIITKYITTGELVIFGLRE